MYVHMYVYIYIHIHIHIHISRYVHIIIYMADSQIVYSEMGPKRKTEESIPYESKKHRGSIEKEISLAPGYAFLTCRGVCSPPLLQGHLN